MDQEIFAYLCGCYACQRHEAANHKSGILTSIIPSFLGEVRPADLVILLVQRSNKYLLLVIEYLSRWTVTIPLPIMGSEAITSALLYEDIFKFGAPRRLITENGSKPNFTSNEIDGKTTENETLHNKCGTSTNGRFSRKTKQDHQVCYGRIRRSEPNHMGRQATICHVRL